MPAADFEELDSSPTGSWSREGTFEGRREFLVFWDDISQFVVDALGSPGSGGMGATGPAMFPGYSAVIAEKVSLRPASDLITTNASEGNLEGNTNKYDMAVMAVEYKTAPPPAGQDPKMPPCPSGTYLEWDLDIGGQFFQPPGRSFDWRPGIETEPTVPPPPDVSPGVFIPESSLVLTWYNVPIPPITYIRRARGKLNVANFLGAHPGQVLFLGAKWYVGFDINGDVKYTLKYFFKEKTPISTSSVAIALGTGAPPYAYGWNHFWSPTAGGNGEHWFMTEPLAYQYIDFLPLFQYGP